MTTFFTHCGKMGDMFMCLPFLSAHFKATGERPVLVLADFPYRDQAVPILRRQDCISDIRLSSFKPGNYLCGGQPYAFPRLQVPGALHVDNVVHLGFPKQPDMHYLEIVGMDLRGLLPDPDFVLDLGERPTSRPGLTVVCDKWPEKPLRAAGVEGTYVDSSSPLLENMLFAMTAERVVSATTASAVILAMAGKDITVMGREARRKAHMEWIYEGMPGKVSWQSFDR